MNKAKQKKEQERAQRLQRRRGSGSVIKSERHQELYRQSTLAWKQNRPEESQALLEQSLALFPTVEKWVTLADILLAQEKPTLEALRGALALEPTHKQARYRLALALAKETARPYTESIEIYEGLLRECPDNDAYRAHLIGCLFDSGEPESAEQMLSQALTRCPRSMHLLDAGFRLCFAQARVDEARSYLDCMLATKPESFKLQLLRSEMLLAAGDFANGWREYELRLRKIHQQQLTQRSWMRRKRRWQGEPIPGKRLYVCGEGGHGDKIQFARFLRAVKEQSQAYITYGVPVDSAGCLACYGPRGFWDEVTDLEIDPSEFDLWIPTMSIPYRIGLSSPEEVKKKYPPLPLKIPEEDLTPWRERLPKSSKIKVGLIWSGNVGADHNHRRSCELRDLSPLAKGTGVEFISLQYGQLADNAPFPIIDWSPYIEDFTDLAPAIASIDLLISIDSAPVHLAGSLGIPVWVALSPLSDWRWMQHERRSDSDWYPTATLYVQDKIYNWQSVFSRIATDLQALVNQNAGRGAFPSRTDYEGKRES